MFWMCIRIASPSNYNTYPQHMILWRNVEIIHFFIILIPTPDFPHFHYMLGGNLGSLLYGDVSVMICLAEAHNRTEVGFEQPTFHSGVRHSPTEPPRSPHPKIENV